MQCMHQLSVRLPCAPQIQGTKQRARQKLQKRAISSSVHERIHMIKATHISPITCFINYTLVNLLAPRLQYRYHLKINSSSSSCISDLPKPGHCNNLKILSIFIQEQYMYIHHSSSFFLFSERKVALFLEHKLKRAWNLLYLPVWFLLNQRSPVSISLQKVIIH